MAKFHTVVKEKKTCHNHMGVWAKVPGTKRKKVCVEKRQLSLIKLFKMRKSEETPLG